MVGGPYSHAESLSVSLLINCELGSIRKTRPWLRYHLLGAKRSMLGPTLKPQTDQVYDIDTNPSSYIQSLFIHLKGITATIMLMPFDSHFASLSVRYASRSNFGSLGSEMTTRMTRSVPLIDQNRSDTLVPCPYILSGGSPNTPRARHTLPLPRRFRQQ